MTAYKARISGKNPQTNNKKDGATGRRRDDSREFEEAGFQWIDWNKLSYTWPGDFPVFILVPGSNMNGHPGWIAKVDLVDLIEIYFHPASSAIFIKTRLDDEILAIMRREAALDDAEIDFDKFMFMADQEVTAW